MKNLYFLDNSERERILNLHESATKNHYLINEVSYGTGNWVSVDNQSQTLTLNNYLEIEDSRNLIGALELKLNKGVTFVRLSSDRLIAKNTPYQKVGDATGIVKTEGTNDIIYYCATKLFQVKGETEKYIGENFQSAVQKAFDQLCESIKVQGQPETQKTEEQQVADWSQKFPCVINYPGAQKIANPRTDTNVSGTVAYKIGEFTYFIDGNQYGKGSYSTYSCDDAFFKNSSRVQANPEQKGGKTSGTPQPYKHAQHVTNVQNKLKEIDPAFAGGVTKTGQMDQATINKLMEILMSKKMPETKVETPAPEGQTPETGV
jgi:hypothetical protein